MSRRDILDGVDYESLSAITNVRELRDIIAALEAEPYYPELLLQAKERLRTIDPATAAMAQQSQATMDEVREAEAELAEWLDATKVKDQQLRQASVDGTATSTKLPPIRGTSAATSAASESKKKEVIGPVDVSASIRDAARREKDKGNECFNAGEHAQALSFYSKSLSMFGGDPVVFTNRAMSHIKLKNFDKVIPLDLLILPWSLTLFYAAMI
jgi:hypothetical protein